MDSPWRPAETAPTDGRSVIAFVPSYYRGKGGVIVATWADGWCDNRAWDVEISHWMPLPERPGGQTEGA